ncbi:MAG: GEVED domain-containing protein, partial [Flavobacteriales bacterium]
YGSGSCNMGVDDVTITEPPACAAPSALAATPTTSGASFSWTENGTATVWNVEYGTPGFTPGTGAEVGAETATTNNPVSSTTTLSANTNYQFYVQADCGGAQSVWSGPFNFYTGYCIPTITNSGDEISSFSTTGGFTNITNPSSGTNAYYDYTGQVVSAAESGTINFSASYVGGSAGWSIWVDWNNDLIFDNVTERVYNAATTASSATGSFSVPAATPNGNYRMRLRAAWNLTSPPSCGNTSYGQTEDYTLSVIAAPTCLPPSAPTVANVSLDGFDVNWTAGGSESMWNIEYGAVGFTPGVDGIPVGGIMSLPYTVSNTLSSNTNYEYYVQADCGGGDLSLWVGPIAFTTPPACGDAFTDPAGASAPYADSEYYEVTIYPTTPGEFVQVTFTAFDTEEGYDGLMIYDGPSTASPVISAGGVSYDPVTCPSDAWSGTNNPGIITSSDVSGALTFVFQSDAPFLGSNAYPGWEATIACVAPCAGTPAIATISTDASVCNGVDFTITSTGAEVAVGITYEWEVSTDGGFTFASAGTTATAELTTNQAVESVYHLVTTCTVSGLSSTSNDVTVTMNAPLDCYCVPTMTYGCAEGDIIARVILNTLDNDSGTGCPSDPNPGDSSSDPDVQGDGYSDYTSDPLLTTTLQAGASYNCTVYAGEWGENYAAWVDL